MEGKRHNNKIIDVRLTLYFKGACTTMREDKTTSDLKNSTSTPLPFLLSESLNIYPLMSLAAHLLHFIANKRF